VSDSRAALVTGGTGRVGSAVAARLQADGFRVLAAGRRDGDLADPGAARALVERAAAELGGLDLVVHAAAEGFAPKAVAELYRNLSQLKSAGLTIIVTEQQVRLALSLTDRAYVLEQGSIRLSGRSADLLGDPSIKKAYLGVA